MKKWAKFLAIAMLLIMSFTMLPGFAASAAAAEAQRDWGALMRLPSEEEIAAYNKSNTERSPYLLAWMDTVDLGAFDEICVDFKADFLPSGTYCCLACFQLDYSALNAQYSKVEGNYNSGYAGFQSRSDPSWHNGILSFWDVFCTDEAGNETVYCPKLIKPAGETAERFDWEGSGVMYRPNYSWEAGKWYRMLLQCGVAEETGNTTMEYWVQDLETKTWTQLGVYDLSVPNVTFRGTTAVFLENFWDPAAGEVRSLEFKNYRVRTPAGEWIPVESGTFQIYGDYPGSYQYGSDGESFWMISSGVPGLAPEQSPERLSIQNSEFGQPF